MPDQDEVVRQALRALDVPPERPTFFEELRRAVSEHERASARVWRRATVALGAITIPAVAAAAVLAATLSGGSAVERTVSCRTQGGGLHMNAFATDPAAGAPGVGASGALVATGATTSLLGVDSRYGGYTLSSSLCYATNKRIPLARAGLRSVTTSSAGQYGGPVVYCPVTASVRLRFRIGLDGSGKPQSASISVWSQPKPGSAAKSHPIAFVSWSQARSATYYASSCTTSG